MLFALPTTRIFTGPFLRPLTALIRQNALAQWQHQSLPQPADGPVLTVARTNLAQPSNVPCSVRATADRSGQRLDRTYVLESTSSGTYPAGHERVLAYLPTDTLRSSQAPTFE